MGTEATVRTEILGSFLTVCPVLRESADGGFSDKMTVTSYDGTYSHMPLKTLTLRHNEQQN